MTTAPEAPVAPLAHPESLFLDGRWVPPSGGLIEVLDPATGRLYVQVGSATEADIDRAVQAARRAFDEGPWPRSTHAERADHLRAMADALDARAADVAAMWPREMGTTHAVAQAFAGTIGDVYRDYAAMASTFPFEEHFPTPPGGGAHALLVREAVGVVGAIIPWNAPINIMAFKIAPALLAGCTVVVKSSPEAPGAGLLMAEIAEQVGLPPGVLNVLTAEREPSERLVRHPDVDKITFTGSLEAGRRIAGIAADRMARVTLELGGKSAAVMLDDYDLGDAADEIAGAACFLSGQVCSALTRIVVPRHRHDALAEALGARFADVRIGDPFDPAVGMGPVATARQRERVEHYTRIGVSEGARLVVGGGRPADLPGWFVEPTVLAGVSNDATVARDEIFGPVLSVIPAADEEDAIEIANRTEFGLNNSVFTRDPDRAYAVARRLRSGTVGHNAFRSDMRIGFGGFKRSGIGREGGPDGLRPFLENKTVVLEGLPAHIERETT